MGRHVTGNPLSHKMYRIRRSGRLFGIRDKASSQQKPSSTVVDTISNKRLSDFKAKSSLWYISDCYRK